MLKPRPWRVVFALIGGFCVILVAAWLSDSAGTICNEGQSGHEQCTTYNLAPFILIQIREGLHSVEGIITALATIAIAVFTWTLYQSSEKMWDVTKLAADAAQKSAEVSERALVDLERAYIFIDKITSDVAEFLAPNLAWTDGRHFPRFTFSIVNFGRTSGNIEFAAIYFDVLNQIPDELTRLHTVVANSDAESVEIIVGPDKRFEFPQLICTNGFTHSHVREMRIGASHLYCHGFFTYRDIFNNSHTTKFCRRYVPGRGEWSPEGGRERNSSN